MVAGMVQTNNRERSFARQTKNVVDLMDRTEKMLRIFSRYEVDPTVDDAASRRFSAANKEARLKVVGNKMFL